MIELINYQVYYNDICLSTLKNMIETDTDIIFVLPDDSEITIMKINLCEFELQTLESYVHHYCEACINYADLLTKAQEQKIAELQRLCNQTILAGFESAAKGEELRHYDFTYDDQINIMGIQSDITNACILGGLETLQVQWKNSSQLICEPWTISEFTALYEDAKTFKETNIVKIHTLKIQVNNAKTIEEVSAIQW